MKKAKFTQLISVAIEPDIYKQLQSICNAKLISISEYLRTIISEAINKSDDTLLETNDEKKTNLPGPLQSSEIDHESYYKY